MGHRSRHLNRCTWLQQGEPALRGPVCGRRCGAARKKTTLTYSSPPFPLFVSLGCSDWHCCRARRRHCAASRLPVLAGEDGVRPDKGAARGAARWWRRRRRRGGQWLGVVGALPPGPCGQSSSSSSPRARWTRRCRRAHRAAGSTAWSGGRSHHGPAALPLLKGAGGAVRARSPPRRGRPPASCCCDRCRAPASDTENGSHSPSGGGRGGVGGGVAATGSTGRHTASTAQAARPSRLRPRPGRGTSSAG
jgi:hypothetical protein